MHVMINTNQSSLVKKTLLAVSLVLSCVVVNAQNDIDIFTCKDITFLGIDYSKARFIGSINDSSSAFPSATMIKDRFFKSWNFVLYDEQNKYNLKEAFKKSILYYDMAY